MAQDSLTISHELLSSALAEFFGVQPDQVKPTIERLVQSADRVDAIHPLVLDSWREKQLSSLKEDWGEEFDGVFKYISEEVFPTLPPQEQEALNNARGMRALAEEHRAAITEHLSSASSEPAPNDSQDSTGSIAPTGSQGSGRGPSPSYKQSQILSMTEEEFKQHEAQINQAYQSGAVDMDIVDD